MTTQWFDAVLMALGAVLFLGVTRMVGGVATRARESDPTPFSAPIEIALTVLSLLILALPVPCLGEFALGTNTGGIEFYSTSVSGSSSSASFDLGNNALINPGGRYPGFKGIVGNAQVFPQGDQGGGIDKPNGSFGPPQGLTGTADPNVINPSFGSGNATIIADTIGGGAGVFWKGASVSDTAVDGTASVNDSRGIATFTYSNPSNKDFTGTIGVVLGIRGNLGEPNAVVAASLRASNTIIDPQGNVTALSPISAIIAASRGRDNLMPIDEVYTGKGTAGDPLVSLITHKSVDFISGQPDGQPIESFTAYAVGFKDLTLKPHSMVKIDATLSLNADPGSEVSYDPSVIPSAVPLPTLGAGIVPEPSSLALLGVGIVGLLGYARYFRAGGLG